MQWKNWDSMGLPKSDGGLGFRNFESFDQALLAKQYWRLFIDPTSLVARVLKEKYYRNVELVDAKLGAKPSMIWRSLQGALNLMKEGLIWRVGNGENIKILGDRWIPKPSTFCIQSPVKLFDENSRVAQLIDTMKSEWKEELIKQAFMADEAEMICNIPLSFSGDPDNQIWGHTKNGMFSFRSAYHVEINRKRVSNADSSYKPLERQRWKAMWGMKILGVVKNFIWKALNNDFIY